MAELLYTAKLQIIVCDGCQTRFAMEKALYELRSNDHKEFYCLNGCCRHFTSKSDEELLRQEISALNERKDRLQLANYNLHTMLTEKEYRIRAQKAAKTRILNRVKNGVCPCCNRTFKDIQAHFKSKHPEMVE